MIVNPPVQHFVISSPIEGRLVDQGKPLANTKLIRTLEWNGDKEGTKEDTVVTDDNGMFAFDVFELDMAMHGLEQFVAKTKIEIQINETSEVLWYSAKSNKALYGEVGKKLKQLICDIANIKVILLDMPSQIMTKCRWDDMPSYTEYVEFY